MVIRRLKQQITQLRGMAQFGGALGLEPRGRRFESCHLNYQKVSIIILKKLLLLSVSVLNKKLGDARTYEKEYKQYV